MTCLEGRDLTALINRLDTNWSLSLRPLYMTPNLGCASSCLISHFVALRVTVSGSDWGDPLEISPRKACLMDETSSHLQSQLTTPVSSPSNTNTLTHRRTHICWRETIHTRYSCSQRGARIRDRESERDGSVQHLEVKPTNGKQKDYCLA